MRALWLLLAASWAWGQCPQAGIPTLARIQGIVVDRQETPITGVAVEIFAVNPDGSAGALAFKTVSDKKGRFSFKGKEGMQYEVRLRHEGKEYKGIRAVAGGPLLARSPGFQHLLLMLGDDACPVLSLAP